MGEGESWQARVCCMAKINENKNCMRVYNSSCSLLWARLPISIDFDLGPSGLIM